MDEDERQHLLDMIAKRDEVIARQAAEIVVLRQTIDALCRRVFGKSSETLDPAQLELMLGGDFAKKAPAADPVDPGPAAEIPAHKKAHKKTRAPRIPDHLPIVREELDPHEVLLNPGDFRRIGEEVREQLHFKPAEFIRIQLVRGKFVRKNDPAAVISAWYPVLYPRSVPGKEIKAPSPARMARRRYESGVLRGTSGMFQRGSVGNLGCR